jgi:nucleotidyltransferase substrate binding protein (TIGR01987 family)
MTEDIRWKQGLKNYFKAMQTLSRAVVLSEQRKLSELEELGLIHGFGFTHELAWNVLMDYLEAQGFVGLVDSKDASREAFKNGLIVDGEAWMDMIKARNLTSQAYNTELAASLANDILQRFYPAFSAMTETFSALSEQAGKH